MEFDGTSTFTVITPGIYLLNLTLNFEAGTPAGSGFALSLNGGVAPIAPIVNSDTAGNIFLTRVAIYAVGDTIAVRNISGNAVTLAEGSGIQNSAGKFNFTRIADGTV